MANSFKWAPEMIHQGGEPTLSTTNIGQPLVINETTVSGTSAYVLFNKNFPFKARILDVVGFMVAAGGVGDTVKVEKGDGAASETFADVTDAVDLSSLGDTDRFAVGEIDDANYTIPVGGSIKITTASDVQCQLTITVVPVVE